MKYTIIDGIHAGQRGTLLSQSGATLVLELTDGRILSVHWSRVTKQ